MEYSREALKCKAKIVRMKVKATKNIAQFNKMDNTYSDRCYSGNFTSYFLLMTLCMFFCRNAAGDCRHFGPRFSCLPNPHPPMGFLTECCPPSLYLASWGN